MLTPSVFLVSGDIRTGKTTWLRHWMGLMKAQGIRYSGVVSLDSTPISELNAAKYLQTPVQPNLHLRRILNVETQQSIEFEIELGNEGNQPVIQVGRFVFSKNAFSQGIQWLYHGLEQESMDWLVLDEVGKLELHRGEGFEPQLSQFFMAYSKMVELRRAQDKSFPKLLVVVRKELLSDFAAQHDSQLPEYQVLNFEGLKEHYAFQIPEFDDGFSKVNGLVLGGGQSSRMGFPKFKVVYNQSQPQWQRLALAMQELVVNCGINIPRNEENNMGAFQEDFQKGFQGDFQKGFQGDFQGTMKSVCDSEYDGKYKSDSNSDSNADTHSCSDTQRVIPIANSKIDDLCDKISWEFDSDSMVNSGPIGGILSYFNQWRETQKYGLLVVAVDYPFLRDAALREMVEVHLLTKKSVFYLDDSTNIINGLIGVYSFEHLLDLERWFTDGNQSLSRFLKQKAPEIYLLTPQNWSELKSVDE